MGFGRKAEDPEPGRCRRTDGKKWRCSKEAYPDSKYCERHMHRGKNRSRKPVEMSLATSLPSSTSSTTPSTSHTPSLYPSPPLSISTPDSYHLLYPCHPSSTVPDVGLNNSHLNLHTPSYTQTDKDYRYCRGMKDVDEYCFFSEASVRDKGSWQFRPLGMSSLGDSKQGSSALQQSTYSHCSRDAEEKQQHCFVLGADFKLERPVKVEREQEEGQRPLRHFFDEWPQKNRDSWMDLEQENSNQASTYSKTQLSISIPMSHHDFPVTGSRYRNGVVLTAS